MPILQPWIAEYLYNWNLLHQKLLDIILQIVNNLQPSKILQFSDEPSDPIIDVVDLNLIVLDIEMAEFNVLPLLDASIVLWYQLP